MKSYREAKGLNLTAMGRLLGVSGMAVSRYEDGSRIPAREVMVRIIEETKGKVRPNDFYREYL